jgi:hypothetical protein
MHAAAVMRDAAASMSRSADRLEEVQQRLAGLLGDGYGNLVSRLVEHLDNAEALRRLQERAEEIKPGGG